MQAPELALVRDASWAPNYSPDATLTVYVGTNRSWVFDGSDEHGRPWWKTDDDDGTLVMRVPQDELVFHHMLVIIDSRRKGD